MLEYWNVDLKNQEEKIRPVKDSQPPTKGQSQSQLLWAWVLYARARGRWDDGGQREEVVMGAVWRDSR